MPLPDNILLVHKGALGDFLCAWPAMAALRRAFPAVDMRAYVRAEHQPFLTPLGVAPAGHALRRTLDGLYAAAAWPAALDGWRVVWLGLRSSPLAVTGDRLAWLSGLGPDGREAPCEAWLRGVAGLLGDPSQERFDWRAAWNAHLPHWAGPAAAGGALLFPGAGHRLKAWPPVQYFRLADWLAGRGIPTRFVLGPAELERGPRPDDLGGRPWIAPRSAMELASLLAGCRLAVGNDSGPMHLAGMVGAPGVALFGPTSRRQWGPPGIAALAADAPCRPCTVDTAGMRCPQALCLERLGQDMVRKELGALLEG